MLIKNQFIGKILSLVTVPKNFSHKKTKIKTQSKTQKLSSKKHHHQKESKTGHWLLYETGTQTGPPIWPPKSERSSASKGQMGAAWQHAPPHIARAKQ
ncbi:MAG: hypothetical protein H9847_06985 [Candidatus Anaerobiospirillum pullicola]|uniref:Uncharacterized protein n=1 Tax=Candidatus Anaerobiospirillum pullicola TaxID=2838451 RepID=A0A948TGP7_9GAMM|nr:hypothetical protein [Candidatus Anaerobiospirillum pullicola]